MDAVTHVPVPVNEPVLDYAPGSPERARLEVALAELASTPVDLPHTIGGKRVMGTGKRIEVRQPHPRHKVLGTMRNATVADAQAAVDGTSGSGRSGRGRPQPAARSGRPGRACLARRRTWRSSG